MAEEKRVGDSSAILPVKRPRLELEGPVRGAHGAEVGISDGDFSGKGTRGQAKTGKAPRDLEAGSVGSRDASRPDGAELENDEVCTKYSSPSCVQDLEFLHEQGDGNISDNVSEISDLPGLGEEAWKPIAGPISWIQRQMALGRNPLTILQDLLPSDAIIPQNLDEYTLWGIVAKILSEPPKRKKLEHINTVKDVLFLLKTCKRIVILTGAGVSVSCGIPDFRSRNGIYARLAMDFPDLPDPQAMFDIHYFKNDSRPFFKFAKEIYPGQFEPSLSHKFIKLIEKEGKLLRNYTQNIDTLEQQAGIKNVIQCHGSFATARCMVCRYKTDAEAIREDIFNQVIPKCPVCPKDSLPSIMKPDIVFFGENLPEQFHDQMAEDRELCDLLIVIGSSLKVRPVALIPMYIPSHVPQILINREPLSHMNFDVELLGDCDVILNELCKQLDGDWSLLSDIKQSFQEIAKDKLSTPTLPPFDKNTGQENETKHPNLSPEQRMLETHQQNRLETESMMEVETPIPGGLENGLALHRQQQDELVKCEHRGLQTSYSSRDVEMQQNKTLLNCEQCGLETIVKEELQEKFNEATEEEFEKADETWDALSRLWHLRGSVRRDSLAKRLKDDEYLFLPPSRYVFHGAEVYSDDEMDYSSSYSSDSLSLSIESNAETENPEDVITDTEKPCTFTKCSQSQMPEQNKESRMCADYCVQGQNEILSDRKQSKTCEQHLESCGLMISEQCRTGVSGQTLEKFLGNRTQKLCMTSELTQSDNTTETSLEKCSEETR